MADKLRALAEMDYDELRAEWRRLYRVHPPQRVARGLLLLAIAWKIQEQAYGGLGKATKRRLADLANNMEQDGDLSRSRVARLRPGAKLIREWQGTINKIVVLEDGFEWNGAPWRSLSAIAREITGSRWSGPRFFGLNERRTPSPRSPPMRKAVNGSASIGKTSIRCAIYTRKSSEEGLEQDFNSLDAQREACEAYILSQKHEGWIALPEMYDDGGISGATMERPALKRLLADIDTGRIDTAVVYKVDRLTRSLGDFAKIVEVFDTRGASFISVTQQFNTTTSMGRLTLNVLLSFAQFEREVTGERIRDKIAASKKNGMWMGGNVPLGYDANDRKLLINQAEAETVRHIYRRYAELGSVRALKQELDHDGIVSKLRIDRYGRQTGGNQLARGALYLMLQNCIYRGEIVHKDNSYPGKHLAIVDKALWEAVQRQLAANRVDRQNGALAAEPSLLAGLIHDDIGERMTPSHANKKGTRYRYYVSRPLNSQGRQSAPHGRRVPAGDLEGLVEDRLTKFLASELEVYGALETIAMDVNDARDLVAQAAALADRWSSLVRSEKRGLVTRLVERIDFKRESIEIRILPGRLPAVLCEIDEPKGFQQASVNEEPTITVTVSARLKRVGMETKLLIEGAGVGARGTPDRSLLRLLSQAHSFHEMVMRNRGKTIAEFAEFAGVGGSYFTRILRLSFLAPDIVKTILRNRHPVELTAKRLADDTRFPIAWEEQRARLGIN